MLIPGISRKMYHGHGLPHTCTHTNMLYTGTTAFHGATPAFLNTNHKPAIVPKT